MSKEGGETTIDDVLFLLHGYKKEQDESGNANGGVSIALSKVAQKSLEKSRSTRSNQIKKSSKNSKKYLTRIAFFRFKEENNQTISNIYIFTM